MSTDKRHGSIATQQESAALTTSYGTESAGWTTKGIDVSAVDWIGIRATYVHNAAVSTLSLKPMAADDQAASLDDYAPMAETSSLTDLELTRSVSGNDVFTFALDVRAVSMLRIAAKADDATGPPTLALEWIGERATIPAPSAASPSVV